MDISASVACLAYEIQNDSKVNNNHCKIIFKPLIKTHSVQSLQVNYLSHWLLISQLLPIMVTSGEDCRIVSLTSWSHKFAAFQPKDIGMTRMNESSFADGYEVYSISKLYQVWYCTPGIIIADPSKRVQFKVWIYSLCYTPFLVWTAW